jgi:hypothetical protein
MLSNCSPMGVMVPAHCSPWLPGLKWFTLLMWQLHVQHGLRRIHRQRGTCTGWKQYCRLLMQMHCTSGTPTMQPHLIPHGQQPACMFCASQLHMVSSNHSFPCCRHHQAIIVWLLLLLLLLLVLYVPAPGHAPHRHCGLQLLPCRQLRRCQQLQAECAAASPAPRCCERSTCSFCHH